MPRRRQPTQYPCLRSVNNLPSSVAGAVCRSPTVSTRPRSVRSSWRRSRTTASTPCPIPPTDASSCATTPAISGLTPTRSSRSSMSATRPSRCPSEHQVLGPEPVEHGQGARLAGQIATLRGVAHPRMAWLGVGVALALGGLVWLGETSSSGPTSASITSRAAPVRTAPAPAVHHTVRATSVALVLTGTGTNGSYVAGQAVRFRWRGRVRGHAQLGNERAPGGLPTTLDARGLDAAPTGHPRRSTGDAVGRHGRLHGHPREA